MIRRMAEPVLPLATLEDGQGWPAQGEWTYEDYLRLPDDGQRYEVIRGVLYLAPSPNYDHQFTSIKLAVQLSLFVDATNLGIVLAAPFDILLPEGIGTPVEPDILFIRKENQPRRGDKNFRGVPDLLVEVISPSSRLYDRRIKLAAYPDAGIPELWLVDPLARTISIYGWRGGSFSEIDRGEREDEVGSAVLPGFRVQVGPLFP